MKPLEGNELLILKSLQEKAKTFSELVKEQHLSGPVVAKHLKSLQKRDIVFRNAERKYESVIRPHSMEPNIKLWKSTDLIDIISIGRWAGIWKILPKITDKKLKFDLTFYFFNGTIGSILANTTKAIDDAAEAKTVSEVQTTISRFIDGYLIPYLHLLAIEAHNFPYQQELRRPFEELESILFERSETALVEFLKAYAKLQKTQMVQLATVAKI